jgi:hypothetical protein
MNNILQKTKSNTLDNITSERLHNSTGNQSEVIAHLKFIIKKITNLLQLLSSRFE